MEIVPLYRTQILNGVVSVFMPRIFGQDRKNQRCSLLESRKLLGYHCKKSIENQAFLPDLLYEL